jgi:hypothetical protein
MPVFLESTNAQEPFRIQLQPSQYRVAWEAPCDGILNLLINKSDMVETAKDRYKLRDQTGFLQFWLNWNNNSLVLFRGFPGCHYCWPDLLQGRLQSEGNDDEPTFTMSNTGKGTTRWLPTARTAREAQNISISCGDIYTENLSMNKAVPVGFTVFMMVGTNRPHAVCWLNPGEIVVRGPLLSGDYNLHSVTTESKRQFLNHNWPAGLSNTALPRQRPYKPTTQKQIDDWWNDKMCQDWELEFARHVPLPVGANDDL